MTLSMWDLLALAAPNPTIASQAQTIGGLLGGAGSTIAAPISAAAQTIPASGGSPSHWEQVAQQMATNRYGYTPEDFSKLDYIISHESSWNPNAVNPSSGAYGIPQIMPSAHPDANLQNDPLGQIKWLLRYVQERYGGIDPAYAFKVAHGWY